MAKMQGIDKPTRENNHMFDDMYYELIEDDWQARAERLRQRHWHLLRQTMKKYHASNTKGALV